MLNNQANQCAMGPSTFLNFFWRGATMTEAAFILTPRIGQWLVEETRRNAEQFSKRCDNIR